MSTVMKVLGAIFVLVAVYLIVTSGGKFNTIVATIAQSYARLVNQLQGVKQNTGSA